MYEQDSSAKRWILNFPISTSVLVTPIKFLISWKLSFIIAKYHSYADTGTKLTNDIVLRKKIKMEKVDNLNIGHGNVAQLHTRGIVRSIVN